MLAKLNFAKPLLARTAIALVAGLAAAIPPAHAIDEQNPDWPCVWRKVVEITPAQIWDGPPLEGLENWRNDDTIRKLSEFVIARRIPAEEVEAAIKKYADSIAEADRDQKLTLLFAATLSRINDERKLIISGIERFHKRQLARAEEIERQGLALPNQGAQLPDQPMPAGEIDKLSEEEIRYNWDVRVFQERQKNIPIACEIPQLIDERAGVIARAIRANMKS